MIFERDGEKTVLAESFSRMPFRTFPPFYAQSQGCAYTYIVNPTPGFLGGDRVRVEIALRQGAHGFIASPAATKVLKASRDHAEQTTHITVSDGATLEYVPAYVIPFGGARFKQKTVVHMERASTCLVLDWFTTGRTGRGESLAFDEYDNSTVLVCEGEPVVCDRFILRPKDEEYRALGRLESSTVSASLYLMHNRSDLPKTLVAGVREALGEETSLAGVSTIGSKGLTVRVMGQAMPPVQKSVVRVIKVIRRMVLAIEHEEIPDRLLNAL
jgi:urease accessory protein